MISRRPTNGRYAGELGENPAAVKRMFIALPARVQALIEQVDGRRISRTTIACMIPPWSILTSCYSAQIAGCRG